MFMILIVLIVLFVLLVIAMFDVLFIIICLYEDYLKNNNNPTKEEWRLK